MPYRTVKAYSDRGSLKDLKEKQENGDDDKLPATPFELRVKELYNHAIIRKDEALIESLGLVAIDGSPTDPVSIFRHREYVNSLSEKLAGQIEETRLELADCFADSTPTINSVPDEMKPTEYRQLRSRATILDPGTLLIKVAGADVSVDPIKRSFRRVS